MSTFVWGLAIVKGDAPVPDLVGTAEIAELLDVSRQRVHQLVTRPDFPKPIAKLAAGMIWERLDVQRWARETGRLP